MGIVPQSYLSLPPHLHSPERASAGRRGFLRLRNYLAHDKSASACRCSTTRCSSALQKPLSSIPWGRSVILDSSDPRTRAP